MDEELRIKKRLIDILNVDNEVYQFDLIKDDENNREKREMVSKIRRELYDKDIIETKGPIGSDGKKYIKKYNKFNDFKKGFYIKLILSELSKNDSIEELNHKNISIGEISHNDLKLFYKQCKMLLRENIITGVNKEPFKNKGENWIGLVKPEIIISDTKLDIILDTDEFNVMAKIEEIMSENKNNQPNISVTGNNNNIANGNNNNQTITINESELINSILELVSKVENEINEEKYNEIINVLEEIKKSPKNKAELWERFIGLTADLGAVSNMVLKAIVPFLQ